MYVDEFGVYLNEPVKKAYATRPSVLVVDDEPLIAMELECSLDQAGFKVNGPAHGVSEALGLIAERRPDFAILDYNLGSENVIPVAEELRRLDVPFVLSSAVPSLDLSLCDVTNIGKPASRTLLAEVLAKLSARATLVDKIAQPPSLL